VPARLTSTLTIAVVAVLSVSLAGTAASASAGCTSPAGEAACIATGAPRAQAIAVATALWNARERALDANDVALLRGIESGSALLGDTYGAKVFGGGYATTYWTRGARTVRSVQVWVPPVKGYPRYFMAGINAAPTGSPGNSTGLTALLVFTRASSAQPWRITSRIYDGGYEGGPGAIFGAPAFGSGGYDAPPSNPVASVARRWTSILVTFYTHLKDSGALPVHTPFAAAPLTTGTDLTERLQGYTANGTVAHYGFAIGDGPWVMNSGGRPIVCADIHEDVREEPLIPGSVFYQPSDRSVWDPSVPPGYYSSMVTTYDWPACILPLASGALGVSGTMDYVVVVEGDRAKPPRVVPSSYPAPVLA
jgi:hypothetical protein